MDRKLCEGTEGCLEHLLCSCREIDREIWKEIRLGSILYSSGDVKGIKWTREIERLRKQVDNR